MKTKTNKRLWEVVYKGKYWLIREVNGAEIAMCPLGSEARYIRDLHNATVRAEVKIRQETNRIRKETFRYQFKDITEEGK
jgi:hypothetical protein